jgi:hypothetical protein
MPSPFNLSQMVQAEPEGPGGKLPYPKTFGAARIDQALLDSVNPGAGLSRAASTVGTTDASAAFQGLLNQVTSNPAIFTPGYNPQMPTTGHISEVNPLINFIDTRSLTHGDETGSVSIGPSGFNVQSAQGWNANLGPGGLTLDSGKGLSARVNPRGAGVNLGPVGVQGTWAGDKSIQANIKLGRDKMSDMSMGMPRFMSEFVTPEPKEQTSYPMLESDRQYIDKVGNLGSEFIPIRQQGFGLEGINPLAPEGQRFGVLLEQPQSEARRLMEQQTDEYAARNPYYRYQ